MPKSTSFSKHLLSPQPEPEAPPVDRFITDTFNDKVVKMLMLGPRVYRYNAAISDFEAKLLYTGDDAWKIANGHIDYLSEADKAEITGVCLLTKLLITYLNMHNHCAGLTQDAQPLCRFVTTIVQV